MNAKESEQNGPAVTGKEPGGPPRRMQGGTGEVNSYKAQKLIRAQTLV